MKPVQSVPYFLAGLPAALWEKRKRRSAVPALPYRMMALHSPQAASFPVDLLHFPKKNGRWRCPIPPGCSQRYSQSQMYERPVPLIGNSRKAVWHRPPLSSRWFFSSWRFLLYSSILRKSVAFCKGTDILRFTALIHSFSGSTAGVLGGRGVERGGRQKCRSCRV